MSKMDDRPRDAARTQEVRGRVGDRDERNEVLISREMSWRWASSESVTSSNNTDVRYRRDGVTYAQPAASDVIESRI